MKYFLDTEFHEYKTKGGLLSRPVNTIELISIGIVDENGRQFYAICKDFDTKAAWANEWLRENVLKGIFYDRRNRGVEFNLRNFNQLIREQGRTAKDIAAGIMAFVYPKHYVDNMTAARLQPQFFAYFADYDWVVFCWIFGRMIDLPKGFPMFCIDLKQVMEDHGLNKEWKRGACPDPEGEHNALVDAKWNHTLFNAIQNKVGRLLYTKDEF